jgi:hypothetical protein
LNLRIETALMPHGHPPLEGEGRERSERGGGLEKVPTRLAFARLPSPKTGREKKASKTWMAGMNPAMTLREIR